MDCHPEEALATEGSKKILKQIKNDKQMRFFVPNSWNSERQYNRNKIKDLVKEQYEYI